MKKNSVLAADIGAGSGKIFEVQFDGSQIISRNVHRFKNGQTRIREHLYNNIDYIYSQIKEGFLRADIQSEAEIRSVGVDIFGNDYGLLNRRDKLIGLPYSYRDARTRSHIPPVDVCRKQYTVSGIAPLPSTAYNQLLADAATLCPSEIEQVSAFLMLADLIGFYLTGEKSSEYVCTSTTGLLDAHNRSWSETIISTLPFRHDVFQKIVPPATLCGTVDDPEVSHLGTGNIRLVKVAGHDSASAVVPIPLTKSSIFISSGSWSLIGIESAEPLISDDTYRFGISNQGLPEGKFRVQKSLPGLWILQQCLKEWQSEDANLDFASIECKAGAQQRSKCWIDVEEPMFSVPGRMTEKIREYCRSTGQTVPDSIGTIARCVYESLVLKYITAAKQFDRFTGSVHDRIYIVGGGAKDSLLNSMVASATSKQVLAGMYDASAIGNALMQLVALGYVRDVKEAREIAAQSFEFNQFESNESVYWEEAILQFESIKKTYSDERR